MIIPAVLNIDECDFYYHPNFLLMFIGSLFDFTMHVWNFISTDAQWLYKMHFDFLAKNTYVWQYNFINALQSGDDQVYTKQRLSKDCKWQPV